MTTENKSFFSFLCNGCFNKQEEAKFEALVSPAEVLHGRSRSKGSTIVFPMNPIKINKQLLGSNLYDTELKTASSTNGEFLMESKLLQGETASSTPRYNMELEVIESDYLTQASRLKLNSEGYVNNVKTKYAQKFYLGTEEPESLEENNSKTHVDIVCAKYKAGGQVQSAKLTSDGTNFFVKEIGGGDGVYIRADDKMELGNNSIVHYGIGHFVIKILKDKVTKESMLKMIFMDGANEGQERTVQADEVCTIGRLSSCTIVFDEYGVSRIQCKIFYENGSWYIKDGDGLKKSTNGTWLLLQEKKKVFNRMVFKVCNTVFKTHILDSN